MSSPLRGSVDDLQHRAYIRDTLQDAVRHATPHDTFRERKLPQIFLSYMESHH
jgi:hypothetical protein